MHSHENNARVFRRLVNQFDPSALLSESRVAGQSGSRVAAGDNRSAGHDALALSCSIFSDSQTWTFFRFPALFCGRRAGDYAIMKTVGMNNSFIKMIAEKSVSTKNHLNPLKTAIRSAGRIQGYIVLNINVVEAAE
jgi:hypothetical protein